MSHDKIWERNNSSLKTSSDLAVALDLEFCRVVFLAYVISFAFSLYFHEADGEECSGLTLYAYCL